MWRFPTWRIFGSLRYRLLSLVLIPLLLLAITVVVFAARWTTDYTYQQLFTKVNTDLRVAQDSIERIQTEQQRTFTELASKESIEALIDNPREINGWVASQRNRYDYDYLMVLNADGSRRLTKDGWQAHTLFHSELTSQALNDNFHTLGGTGIDIIPAEAWQRDRLLQPAQVVFPLIDTPRATPSDRSAEDRAMVIRSVEAVRDTNGKRIALLEGGRLLNRDFGFVDQIRDLVYGPGSLAPGSIGTVTVFLDDVRITTNVPSRDATRALGTRVSAEVRKSVLDEGTPWTDRAFVVNDWYISAYQPILDVGGDRVGMLYAGYLEAPFRKELFKAIAVLSGLVLAGSLFAIGVATVGARSIFRPIESLTSVVRATAAGKRRRVGSVDSVNEIGELAAQFDGMLDTLEYQRQEIEQSSYILEDKVQSRTAQLSQQNQRLTNSLNLLQQTQQQLEAAEKLAALGELTAGVAHEINNPTAVILGNMDILISEIDTENADVKTEIDLIIQQVYRIRSITHRLVQYSRSENEQMSPIAKAVWLPDVVSDTVYLVKHEFVDESVTIKQNHHCTQAASIDKHELQQVLVNLIRNAIEAVDSKRGKAEICIETSDRDEQETAITITDNGIGIEPKHVAKLFDPFFTVGKERGTGLGLSVSYGIVRRHGGRIEVTSKLGEGSTFTVILPVSQANQVPRVSQEPMRAVQEFDDVLAEFKN